MKAQERDLFLKEEPRSVIWETLPDGRAIRVSPKAAETKRMGEEARTWMKAFAISWLRAAVLIPVHTRGEAAVLQEAANIMLALVEAVDEERPLEICKSEAWSAFILHMDSLPMVPP